MPKNVVSSPRARRAAVFSTALAAAAVSTILTAVPAHAGVAYGSATVTPDDYLVSGQVVEVAVSGFPANSTVYGVQCDERIITTGDNSYCDTTNVAVLSTGPDGTGTANVTVKAGEDFTSGNGQGVCDAQSPCQMAFQHSDGTTTTVAVAGLAFGTRSYTFAEVVGDRHRASKPVDINATVIARSAEVPTGTVTVSEGGKVLATAELAPSGEVTFDASLSRGRHVLKVAYGGDEAFRASTDRLLVRVR